MGNPKGRSRLRGSPTVSSSSSNAEEESQVDMSLLITGGSHSTYLSDNELLMGVGDMSTSSSGDAPCDALSFMTSGLRCSRDPVEARRRALTFFVVATFAGFLVAAAGYVILIAPSGSSRLKSV